MMGCCWDMRRLPMTDWRREISIIWALVRSNHKSAVSKAEHRGGRERRWKGWVGDGYVMRKRRCVLRRTDLVCLPAAERSRSLTRHISKSWISWEHSEPQWAFRSARQLVIHASCISSIQECVHFMQRRRTSFCKWRMSSLISALSLSRDSMRCRSTNQPTNHTINQSINPPINIGTPLPINIMTCWHMLKHTYFFIFCTFECMQSTFPLYALLRILLHLPHGSLQLSDFLFW